MIIFSHLHNNIPECDILDSDIFECVICLNDGIINKIYNQPIEEVITTSSTILELSIIKPNKYNTITTICGHHYHSLCLETYFKYKTNKYECPICRNILFYNVDIHDPIVPIDPIDSNDPIIQYNIADQSMIIIQHNNYPIIIEICARLLIIIITLVTTILLCVLFILFLLKCFQ